MKNKENKVVLKSKYFILAGLSLVVVFGSSVLLWQISKQNRPENPEVALLKSEIDNLNKKIDTLNKSLEEAKNQSPIIETNTYTRSSSGRVLGSQNSSDINSKLNINTASLSQLDGLPGIGPAYAERIINYREANGGFKSIEEIKNIKGIGDKTFEKFRDLITV